MATAIAAMCPAFWPVPANAQGKPVFLPTFPAPAPGRPTTCLHGVDELPAQAARRREGLTIARSINTAQAQQRVATGSFLDSAGLFNRPDFAQLRKGQSNELASGWLLRIAAAVDGYVFALKDATDPCQFAYFSDESGLIYLGQPIQ